MFLDKKTIEKALQALEGTADHMIKIWFVLKAMGLTTKNSVFVDTSNSSDQLKLLFHSGSPDGQFCVPFVAAQKKYRFMKGDASRSIVQTNVKKWMDGTVSSSDPRSLLDIKEEGTGYRVSSTATYPVGLGADKKQFAPSTTTKACIPLLDMAVWVFAQDAIPDAETNVADYLKNKLRKTLNLQNDEEKCLFGPSALSLSFSESPITDAELYELCSGTTSSSTSAANGESFNLPSLVSSFSSAVDSVGLKYKEPFLRRFIAALLAKPFVVLTGLSGSGKTKLAEAFAAWLDSPEGARHLLVPVGADWTNNEHLLGYPNALEEGKYVMPDTGVLAFLLDAAAHPEAPYFLILDEMNLSHVERYFADFLSAMESNKRTIRLHGGLEPLNKGEPHEVPPTLALPRNLFVIGTMNVDETTYMFSPKVLDRAQVLEFRVSETEMSAFLANPPELKFDSLEGKGAAMAVEFLKLAQDGSHGVPTPADAAALQAALNAFFPPLAELGAEFGYRSAAEVLRFAALYREAGAAKVEEAIDAGVIQKLLPKLHGSQARLGPVLKTLAGLASVKRTVKDEESEEEREESVPLYPLAHDKIDRMRKRLNANGFSSFAEA